MTSHIVNQPKLIRYDPNAIDILSQSDGSLICKSLIKKSQSLGCRNYEWRAELLISWHAVSGGGGEFKWVRASA